jgi:hypothetical protein
MNQILKHRSQLLSDVHQLLRQGSSSYVRSRHSFSYFDGMAKLVASTFIGSGSLWLYLDNELVMQNSDTLTLELEDNAEYIVHWFVKGAAGSSYSITISSPREAQYQLTRGLGRSGKGFDSFHFKV